MSRSIRISRIYLSDPHRAHYTDSDFRHTSTQDPQRYQADTAYAIRRVDASADTTARQMCRMRIPPILCRCVVRKSQTKFLRKTRGNLRKVGNADLRSLSCAKPVRKALQPSLDTYKRGLTLPVGASLLLALRFNLRPTPLDLHNQTGGTRLTKGICENNDPNPTDRDEYKPRWRYALFT